MSHMALRDENFKIWLRLTLRSNYFNQNKLNFQGTKWFLEYHFGHEGSTCFDLKLQKLRNVIFITLLLLRHIFGYIT